jgi:hypothetical protein
MSEQRDKGCTHTTYRGWGGLRSCAGARDRVGGKTGNARPGPGNPLGLREFFPSPKNLAGNFLRFICAALIAAVADDAT